MRICIVIPVYNEAAYIAELVVDIKKKGWDVVVVDDGSSDQGGVMAKEKGAVVITHKKKSGKGLSLRDGFDYALKDNYDGVITMDGDGQHDPSDIQKFIDKAGEAENDIIIGNRMENHQKMPLIRFAVNKIMSAMISSVCRQNIPDSQCGFRFISRRVLKEIKLSSSDFEIESEVLIKASKKGLRFCSVPIKTIYRQEKSKINPFRDTIRFFVYIIREALNSKS